jgi:predicted transcriptional regulator
MITFACKNILIKDLIQCALGLNKTAYNVLMFLLKQKNPRQIKEMSKEINLKRCSIQKAIQNLYKKGLIIKSQKNLEKGGYTYFYQSIQKKEIKEKIKQTLDSWVSNADKQINQL